MTEITAEQDDEDEAEAPVHVPEGAREIRSRMYRSRAKRPAPPSDPRVGALIDLLLEYTSAAQDRFASMERRMEEAEARLDDGEERIEQTEDRVGQTEDRVELDGRRRARLGRNVETLAKRQEEDSRESYDRHVELQRRVADIINTPAVDEPMHLPATWSPTTKRRSTGTSTGNLPATFNIRA